MKLLNLLLLLVSTTVIQIFGKLEYDWGLKEACIRTGGVFKQRNDKMSIVGDKCALSFPVATSDDAESRDFCELYAPWRLIKTERPKNSGRHTTVCHVESTLICEDGWWSMFGHCFKMPDKHMVYTYDEAKDLCGKAAPNGTIAYMHHKYIVGMWRRYFSGTSQIWVRASESWNQYTQKTNTVDGDALALAFTGKHFNFAVHANSLIKIDPNVKLNVLCQYKPKITPAEINYLGRRYTEIYYPSIPVENGIMVRSASSYTSSVKNWVVCEKVLKPFMIEKVGDFIPEDSVLQSMTDQHLELIYLTRSGAIRELDENGQSNHLNKAQCGSYPPEYKVKVQSNARADYPVKNITFEPSDDCENMLSAAITHFPDETSVLKIMSDSRSLPIWCKLGRPEKFEHEKPPPGYEVFDRNREYFAHKLHTEVLPYDKAKKVCESEGSRLAGIDARKEADLMISMARKAGLNNIQFWVGGRRKPECMSQKKWNTTVTHECYRSRVIQWEHAMAREFEESWWKDGPTAGTRNPDFANRGQACLSIVVGNPAWADPKSGGFLDDLGCDGKYGFFCSQKIAMTKKAIDE